MAAITTFSRDNVQDIYILEFLDLCEECERFPDKRAKDLLPARSDDDAHCGAQDDAEWATY
jgi:hypothetical protein